MLFIDSVRGVVACRWTILWLSTKKARENFKNFNKKPKATNAGAVWGVCIRSLGLRSKATLLLVCG